MKKFAFSIKQESQFYDEVPIFPSVCIGCIVYALYIHRLITLIVFGVYCVCCRVLKSLRVTHKRMTPVYSYCIS